MDRIEQAVVIGADASGIAAYELLEKSGAAVWLAPESKGLTRAVKAELAARGIQVTESEQVPRDPGLVVHSSNLNRKTPALAPFLERNLRVISDLELAGRHFSCLAIGISGTNGKTTTAELVASMLTGAQRKTARAGASGSPVCGVVAASRELDFVTLDVNSFQLESIEHFRPAVAVLTNVRRDHMDKYANLTEYARVLGRIFENQQAFDWAIIQTEALAHLRSLSVPIPSKIITFSASHRRADIFLDRGLLISTLPNWSGPLFDMDQCALRGPHNAENVMAALAVGRVLRLSLEEMIAAVKAYKPGPHRLELVAEKGGVRFINNSKALNVDAVWQSIEALPPERPGEPNIWLIAGGRDSRLHYHDLGPLLALRVKGAFLLGESRERLRAAWSLFTPCWLVDDLSEAVSKAAESAVAGDVVLLSPACSSLDMFRSYQHRGEEFRAAVEQVIGETPAGIGRAETEHGPIAI